MDPIRAVQCRLKFRSESSKSGVRLQEVADRPLPAYSINFDRFLR